MKRISFRYLPMAPARGSNLEQSFDTRWSPLPLAVILRSSATSFIRWIQSNPNHDVTMRIGSEAPKQRADFRLAFKPWIARATATSDGSWQFVANSAGMPKLGVSFVSCFR